MPFLVVSYFLFIGVLALMAQMCLPHMYPLLGVLGLGSSLVPLVVIYTSLELGDERAPIIAVILGLLLDLTLSCRLGTSVMILFSLSALIVTQAQKPESHSWVFRLTFVMVGTFLFYLLSYTMDLVESARWFWPFAVWTKIVFGTLLNVVLAPIFFLVVGWLPRRFGWKPIHELQDRYGHAR